MNQFFTFTLQILTIEPFDPSAAETTGRLERASGYYTVEEGKSVPHDHSKVKIVTVKVGKDRLVRFLVDAEALKIETGQEVTVIMSGGQVACALNAQEGIYAVISTPLNDRFIKPKIWAGFNMALASVVAGYLLSIIMFRQNWQLAGLITEICTGVFLIGSLAFSAYYYFNDASAHTKLRQYLKKILR